MAVNDKKDIKLYNIAWILLAILVGYNGFCVLTSQFVICAATLLVGALLLGLFRGNPKFFGRYLLKNFGITIVAQAVVLILAFIFFIMGFDFLSPALSEFPITDPREMAVVSVTEFAVMFLTIIILFLFNYFHIYKKEIAERPRRLLLSLWLSVINGPCMYLLIKLMYTLTVQQPDV